jgi:hypothetical protein
MSPSLISSARVSDHSGRRAVENVGDLGGGDVLVAGLGGGGDGEGGEELSLAIGRAQPARIEGLRLDHDLGLLEAAFDVFEGDLVRPVGGVPRLVGEQLQVGGVAVGGVEQLADAELAPGDAPLACGLDDGEGRHCA